MRIAARSPGPHQHRARCHPQPTPISVATMPASEVLPSPGGPAKSRWSTGWPRRRAASQDDVQVLDQLGLPDELGQRAGVAAGLFGLLGRTGHRVHRRPRRSGSAPHGRLVVSAGRSPRGAPRGAHRARQLPQRLRAAAPRTEPVLAEPVERPPDLVGPVAEPGQGGADLGPRPAAGSPPRRRPRRSRAAPVGSRGRSGAGPRSCVPTPGTAHSASTSSSSTAGRQRGRGQRRQDGQGQRRPDPVGAEQGLEAAAARRAWTNPYRTMASSRTWVCTGRYDVGCRRAELAARRGAAPSPGSRPRRRPRSTSAAGRRGGELARAATRSRPALRRAADAPAQRQRRSRWQTASASASAASGGGAARPARAAAATIRWTWSLVALP